MCKCKICGGQRFLAHQVCRMDVVVDGDNEFLSNAGFDGFADSAIYDSERPYGPYICAQCGAEYEELRDGMEPTEQGWRNDPFFLYETEGDGAVTRYHTRGLGYDVDVIRSETGTIENIFARPVGDNPWLPIISERGEDCKLVLRLAARPKDQAALAESMSSLEAFVSHAKIIGSSLSVLEAIRQKFLQ